MVNSEGLKNWTVLPIKNCLDYVILDVHVSNMFLFKDSLSIYSTLYSQPVLSPNKFTYLLSVLKYMSLQKDVTKLLPYQICFRLYHTQHLRLWGFLLKFR